MVRVGIMAGVAACGVIPICHAFALGLDTVILRLDRLLVMYAIYAVGFVAYVFRVPERWAPGSFDLVGNSHQVMHVMVVVGAIYHYHTCRMLFGMRHSVPCAVEGGRLWSDASAGSVGSAGFADLVS